VSVRRGRGIVEREKWMGEEVLSGEQRKGATSEISREIR